LWGAPRIHGELLTLGYELAESTVSKYMIRRRGPPSQTWRTFLRNHALAPSANVPTTFGLGVGEVWVPAAAPGKWLPWSLESRAGEVALS
jgi:hypothetical protein